MALKASDLPYSTRQEMLGQIRAYVGSDQYDQMVDAIGEDGVIDLILAQASPVTSAQSRSTKKKGLLGRITDGSISWIAARIGKITDSWIFWLAVIAVILVVMYITGVDFDVRSNDPIFVEAEKLLAELSTPSSKTQDEWGMSTFRVFGRGEFLWWFMITVAGPTETREVADSPETKEVIIPLWVEGKSLAGEPLRCSRKLCVTVVKSEGEAGWKVQSHEFRNDQPLAFWQQLVRWLVGASIAPVAVLIVVLFGNVLSDIFDLILEGFDKNILDFSVKIFDSLPRWYKAVALSIFGVLVLLFVGYLSYYCFGSTGAGIVGVIVYVVVIYLILRLRASLLRRAREFQESR